MTLLLHQMTSACPAMYSVHQPNFTTHLPLVFCRLQLTMLCCPPHPQLTMTMAQTYAPKGIRFNAVAPGAIDTEAFGATA
jgi:hypothetical protein